MHNAFQNSSHDHGPCLMTSSLVLLITKVKVHEMTLNKLKLKKLCENKLSFAPQKNQLMGSFFTMPHFGKLPTTLTAFIVRGTFQFSRFMYFRRDCRSFQIRHVRYAAFLKHGAGLMHSNI